MYCFGCISAYMKAAWGVNVAEVFGLMLLKIIACITELS